VSLLKDLLDHYLYKEDVQTLARELGLPTSRNKDELVDAIIRTGDLDPYSALGFLNAREARDFCRSHRLLERGDSRRDRGYLIELAYGAMELEEASSPRVLNVDPSHPTVERQEHPDTAGAWAIVTIVLTAVIGAITVWALSSLGLVVGSTVVAISIVTSIVGLVTYSRRLIPGLAFLMARKS
jgi:hypothetical protein